MVYRFLTVAFSTILIGHSQTVKDGELSRSIVQVVVHVGTQYATQGTAFLIGKDLLASAFHVYAGALKTVSDTRGGGLEVRRVSRNRTFVTSGIEVAAADAEVDLIILKMTNTGSDWDKVGGLRPLKLSDRAELVVPMPAHTIGYFGSDNFPTYLRCEISGTGTIILGPPRGEVEELLLSGMLLPGHSGSPVVGDDGEVLGVISSIVPASLPFNTSQLVHSGFGKAVKVEHLKRILNSIGSK